jgi:hypothetical protein
LRRDLKSRKGKGGGRRRPRPTQQLDRRCVVVTLPSDHPRCTQTSSLDASKGSIFDLFHRMNGTRPSGILSIFQRGDTTNTPAANTTSVVATNTVDTVDTATNNRIPQGISLVYFSKRHKGQCQQSFRESFAAACGKLI